MKYITLVTIVVFMLVSCKKENNNSTKSRVVSSGYTVKDSGSINGHWELRILYGCQTPNCNPNFAPGNGNTWKFIDSAFKHTVNSESPKYTASDSGYFSLGRDTCQATGRLMDFFSIRDVPNLNIYFEITKDTLILYQGVIAADGVIEKYVRF
ncbi:MAG: hypothetical protein ABJB11_17925 [Ferruginibacter sp.]